MFWRKSEETAKRYHLKPLGNHKPNFEDQSRIPQEESELLEFPFYWNMKGKFHVTKLLEKQSDIKTPVLRMIYWGHEEEAIEQIAELYHSKVWDRDFQYDLLLCFWLAVHCEDVQLTARLMQFDIFLR